MHDRMFRGGWYSAFFVNKTVSTNEFLEAFCDFELCALCCAGWHRFRCNSSRQRFVLRDPSWFWSWDTPNVPARSKMVQNKDHVVQEKWKRSRLMVVLFFGSQGAIVCWSCTAKVGKIWPKPDCCFDVSWRRAVVVFFLGSEGATLKFYLEGAKTIQVCLGEDLALTWLLLIRFVTSCNGSFVFGLPRCHFEVLRGRCQDDPGLSWGKSGLNWLVLWCFMTSCNGSFSVL